MSAMPSNSYPLPPPPQRKEPPVSQAVANHSEHNGLRIKEEPDLDPMDDEDAEEGEFIQGAEGNQHHHHYQEPAPPPSPMAKPPVRHSMPAAVHVAPHTQQQQQPYHQAEPNNIVIDSVFHQAEYGSVSSGSPLKGQADYLTSFLDYAKVRSQSFTGRQKRQIINALTTLMNNADEENESNAAGADYSYQMYDYNYANPPANTLK